MSNETRNDAIEKFLKETMDRAWELGLDFFVVCNGGNFRANNLSDDMDVKHAYDSYQKFHQKNEIKVDDSDNHIIDARKSNFADLYNYAKSIETGDNGFHLLTFDCSAGSDETKQKFHDLFDDDVYPRYYIKPTFFENHASWVEFYVQNEKDGLIAPVVEFIYHNDNDVNIVKKIGNMPDYENSFRVPIEREINSIDWDKISRNINVGGILLDLLTPIIN